jgi:hypothetical protein
MGLLAGMGWLEGEEGGEFSKSDEEERRPAGL